MTEDWILKLAGFLNGPDWDVPDNESNGIVVDSMVTTVIFSGCPNFTSYHDIAKEIF